MTQSGTALTAFEGLRGRLFGLAYRMLGSRADAEDIVQEAYVRWHEVTKDRIDNPEAWLVTTTSRLAIDRLRRLKTEREAYVGQWLPQPIVTDAPPDRHLDLADDLSMAFLTLLERLAPEERAAFLLHDVFDVGYPEIASVIEKTESAVPPGRASCARARAWRPQALRCQRVCEGGHCCSASLRPPRHETSRPYSRCLRPTPHGLRTAAEKLLPPASDRRRRSHRQAGDGSARKVLGERTARWRSRPSTARLGCASAMAIASSRRCRSRRMGSRFSMSTRW